MTHLSLTKPERQVTHLPLTGPERQVTHLSLTGPERQVTHLPLTEPERQTAGGVVLGVAGAGQGPGLRATQTLLTHRAVARLHCTSPVG